MVKTPAKLLIIDDEERIRHLLLAFLEDFDEFATLAVSSAEEALAVLARERYDLCLVDIRLPGMTGQDFVIEAMTRGLCDRFLLHTGSIDYFLPDQLSQRGLSEADVLNKPCDMQVLLERIRDKLQTTGTGHGDFDH